MAPFASPSHPQQSPQADDLPEAFFEALLEELDPDNPAHVRGGDCLGSAHGGWDVLLLLMPGRLEEAWGRWSCCRSQQGKPPCRFHTPAATGGLEWPIGAACRHECCT